jgi:hypothetical protein
LEGSKFQIPSARPVWARNQIPVAVVNVAVLAESVAIGLRRDRVRTERTDEHEAGESDDAVVHIVNSPAVINLKAARLMLDTLCDR